MNIGMSGKRSAGCFTSATVLLAVLAAAPLAGCVSNATDRSATAVDDEAITAGVLDAMARDPQLKMFDIGVTAYQGIVRLSGFVGSTDSVGAAASVARSVKGVRSVRNDLRLK
ncbi:BON domain-containing protein [Massilia sp.]|uniref:BON domain-containing protein n=1 Tax=Massilia sp. TaxID=1882437 RepID=UPI0028A18199|nr:BON domain-containing protein [Massilia sp.]